MPLSPPRRTLPFAAAAAALLLAACDARPPAPRLSLPAARRPFVTRIVRPTHAGAPAPAPPAGMFDLVHYRSPAGELAAYVSHAPGDGARHPAILWLVGGFSNDISELAWTPGPASNDQSASAFREAGVLMMYPSLRGGNDNPGQRENFYGEVDDVLAARDWLARQPSVDPARVYLGGHSTGGTLALLVDECAGGFRGVFAFGPVTNPVGYGSNTLAYDTANPVESRLRAPVSWLEWITSPTFIFEGTDERSNISELKRLEQANRNPLVQFHPITGATHFSGLQPVSRLIARKILADTGPATNLAFTPAEMAAAGVGTAPPAP